MIEAVDWREYDTFFASLRDACSTTRAAWRCRRSSCPTRASTAQAPHRLHQEPRSSPAAASLRSVRSQPPRTAAGSGPAQRRRHRPALRRNAAPLEDQPPMRSTSSSPRSGSTRDSSGSGSSTSPTAKRHSTNATSARTQLLYTAPGFPDRHNTAAPAPLPARSDRGLRLRGRLDAAPGRRADLQEVADLLDVHYMTAYPIRPHRPASRNAAASTGTSRDRASPRSRGERTRPQAAGRPPRAGATTPSTDVAARGR